jgi:hypothetical protein
MHRKKPPQIAPMGVLHRRFTQASPILGRGTGRSAVAGALGLALIAVASCGASVDATVGFALRDRLSRWPALAWLDPVTPIGEVSQSRGTTVYLDGIVARHLPLLGQGLYELVDDSGAIWVLSPTAPPPLGTALTVRAVLQYEQILLRGQDIGEYYAQELERLPREE